MTARLVGAGRNGRQERTVRRPFAVLLAAWLVPGAGHYLLGQRGRGAAFFAAIVVTFAIGLAITGGSACSPSEHPVAFVAQVFAGLPALVPAALEYIRGAAAHSSRLSNAVVAVIDLGLLFTMIAGLLNLLLAEDAYERATRRTEEGA